MLTCVDQQEHDRNLEEVLRQLQDKGFTLNKQKCQFRMPRLKFMGHVLSAHGIGPDETKIESLVNARNPDNLSEVRGFLGLVNFCARFIPDLATVAEPLRELTRAKATWRWNAVHQNAFDELKNRLTHASTMAYYDTEAHTQVIVDASPVGLGAVLSQRQPDGSYRPVYYASKALTYVERRYSQTEKEPLAVVWGCERFTYTYMARNFNSSQITNLWR